MKKLLLSLSFVMIGCTPTPISSLTKEAEFFLQEVNIDYSHILCSKKYETSADCVVLNNHNQLMRLYCDEGGCYFKKCKSESCIQKLKVEKVEFPYVMVDDDEQLN